MGFLEDLRKQKATEAEALRIARQNSETERLAGLERAKEQKLQQEREKRLREDSWRKAKDHFEQSGVRDMLNEVVRLGAGSMSEDLSNRHRGTVKFEKHHDNSQFFNVFLGIREEEGYTESGNPCRKSLFVNIYTDAEGTITFQGGIKIWIPKAQWASNRDVLERTLQKTYENPDVHIHSVNYGSSSTPDMGRGGA